VLVETFQASRLQFRILNFRHSLATEFKIEFITNLLPLQIQFSYRFRFMDVLRDTE